MTVTVSREELCGRLRSAVDAHGWTLTEVARVVSDHTNRSVHRQHVSAALRPMPDKFDMLRRDMAAVLLGGSWEVQRTFVQEIPDVSKHQRVPV